MDIREALLVKPYYKSQLASVTATNAANHKYPRGRDQNEYKITIC